MPTNRQNMSAAPEAGHALCRRCGMCCLRGGPTLLAEDAPLLAEGVVPLEDLVCLRAGEWTRDDARNSLRPLDAERVKVAGTGGRVHPWRCLYYQEGAGCSIHVRRPLQCSVLFCADTGPLEALLAEARPLDRAEALKALGRGGACAEAFGLSAATRALLPDILAAHEEQNPVRPVMELAAGLGFTPSGGRRMRVERPEGAAQPGPAGRAKALARLGQAVRTEAAFRELCVARIGLPAALLPFLLGRPLADLVAEVGLRPVDRS